MRIMMLTWEFPPRVVGGLARHVSELSIALARLGHEVHVVTIQDPQCPPQENYYGVRVWRATPRGPRHDGLVQDALQMNLNLLETAVSVMGKVGPCDLFHAHDWLVAHSGVALKHAYQRPLVVTIHATEWGRNGGLHNDLQRQISDVEWWLCYEAWTVICCSQYMYGELQGIFQVPSDKLHVIPNGVNGVLPFLPPEELAAFRARYAADHEQVVFFMGRLVREKGVHILLDALAQVVRLYPNTKLIVSGEGPERDFLQNKVSELGLQERVCFTGFINDELRNRFLGIADVAVFPSTYEPFGIVALEAMAARVPVIVSNVGGFDEIIQHGINGLKFYSGDANSLVDNLLTLFGTPNLRSRLIQRARQDVLEKYNWQTIAQRTATVYQQVLERYRQSPWAHQEPATRDWASMMGRWLSPRLPSRYQETTDTKPMPVPQH